MKMVNNLTNVYLNEVRLAETETWCEVDELIHQLNELVITSDGDYSFSNWSKHSLGSYELFIKLTKAWSKHEVAANILSSMMDKTYGEIIEEDGDWYIKEDREEQTRKEALEDMDKIAREAWDMCMKKDENADDDEYI